MTFLNMLNATDKVEVTVDILQLALAATIGFILGVIVVLVTRTVFKFLLRKRPALFESIRPAAFPLHLGIGVLGAWLAISYVVTPYTPSWYAGALHAFIVIEIIAATWLVTSVVGAIEHIILTTVRENSQSRYRKVQTQLQILQRVITVVIWLCGFAAVLLTFPDARTIGTSMLASAGIVSVVAGIAAQSTLSNVFAGLQLAFSDSIRVGDVVFWANERCVVEEITLTYVVLRVWDGRRLIVPSSKMTSTTFENWTRCSSELIDHVDFRLDWSAPIAEIREHLNALLKATDLWDGRIGVLQVRDTDNEYIQISALISAKNSSTMIDLRSYLREEMVTWLQENYPDALPHVRYFNYNFEETQRPGGRKKKLQKKTHDGNLSHTAAQSSLFTGSREAEARAQEFESAGAVVAAEREEAARRRARVEADTEAAEHRE
ncbi:MAG: mechanosensitive ion channel [Actinomycetaceae bacterium]|nr:mechanosensitive ion channel [Actinomycetaceae bacterium]